jgi:heme/copper-type cytochrome/quinol oxidase subunit 3
VVSVATRVLPLSDRRFFTRIALAMMAVVFAGFARTYYLAGLTEGPGPLLTPMVHIHGALCTAWILLLVVQTRLVAAGRRDIHRRLGAAGALVAAAVLLTGLFVALNSERRIHTAATADTLADPYVFLIFPFASVGLFALFVTLGALHRHRADAHKRLMLLATANLIIPALARLVTQSASGMGVVGFPGVVGAMVLVNAFLIALAVHDYNTRGQLHPVTLWGGALILISEPLRFAIGYSEPWQALARAMMS